MGVPSFYRWLCRKYPRVPIDAVGDEQLVVNGDIVPTDTSAKNPNNIEFDNLYLDMNGIIHPCCNPNSGAKHGTEPEMFLRIFAYIDRIFSIVRPRKVLYMAIDGVAPRAKMNQQRQRRFRAVQERQEQQYLEEKLREIYNAAGMSNLIPPRKPTPFDSNVITPGTPFMANLSEALRHYITDRTSNDPGWRNVKVIFSDATVPGEGEHKIMHFIRNQRSQPDYNPNTVHCLYGMDADLIMLGLASHEPKFYIVREVVMERHAMVCSGCGKKGHHAGECTSATGKEVVIKQAELSPEHFLSAAQCMGFGDTPPHIEFRKRDGATPYQFLSLSILREYLNHELHFASQLYDLERAIDDWVFLCFFVGNDFLPHLPSLEIRDNAIGVMTKMWKSIMISEIKAFEQSFNYQHNPRSRDSKVVQHQSLSSLVMDRIPAERLKEEQDKIYLTSSGDMNLRNVYAFIQKFQQFEVAIFYSRSKIKIDKERKRKRLEDMKAKEAVEKESAKIVQTKINKVSDLSAINTVVVDEGDSVVIVDNEGDDKGDDKGDGKDKDANAVAVDQDDKIRKRRKGKEREENKPKRGDGDGDMADQGKDATTTPGEPGDATAATDTDTASDAAESRRKRSRKSKEPENAKDMETVEMGKDDSTASTDQDESIQALIKAGIEEGMEDEDDEGDEDDEDESESESEDPLAPSTITITSDDSLVPLPSEIPPAKKKRQRKRNPMGGDELSVTNTFVAFEATLAKLKDKLAIGPPSEDTVRFGEQGYEHRYYLHKFHIDISKDTKAFNHIHLSYITGLRWVLHYYYKGCSSWDWFYPYHYAPLITSLAKITFDQYLEDTSSPLQPASTSDTRDPYTISTTSLYSSATPILPFEQLLSVFPAASSHALPPHLAKLMTEPDSEIADYYPSQFGLDMNHKKYLWQGVVLLPFIDMGRLQRAVKKVEHTLTYEEMSRNRHGVSYFFSHHPLDLSAPDVHSDWLVLQDVRLSIMNKFTQLESEYYEFRQQERKKASKKGKDSAQQVSSMNSNQATAASATTTTPSPSDTNTSTTITAITQRIGEFIKQWKAVSKALKPFEHDSTRRANDSETYQQLLTQKSTLFRAIRQIFSPIITPGRDLPSLFEKQHTSEQARKEYQAILASPYTEHTHDTSLWKYEFTKAIPATALSSVLIDRVVEPYLAQYCSSRFKTASLQGDLSMMVGQVTPGSTVTPGPAFAHEQIPKLTLVQCISFVYNQPPSLPHHSVLLKDANSNPLLTEVDLRDIGRQKRTHQEFTFEYLFEVIKSSDVYNHNSSASTEVISYDEIDQQNTLNKTSRNELGRENTRRRDGGRGRGHAGQQQQQGQQQGQQQRQSGNTHTTGATVKPGYASAPYLKNVPAGVADFNKAPPPPPPHSAAPGAPTAPGAVVPGYPGYVGGYPPPHGAYPPYPHYAPPPPAAAAAAAYPGYPPYPAYPQHYPPPPYGAPPPTDYAQFNQQAYIPPPPIPGVYPPGAAPGQAAAYGQYPLPPGSYPGYPGYAGYPHQMNAAAYPPAPQPTDLSNSQQQQQQQQQQQKKKGHVFQNPSTIRKK